MISGLALMMFGSYVLYISLQLIIYKRMYWAYPTINKFSKRNERSEKTLWCYVIGVTKLLFAIFLYYLAVTCMYG